MLKATFIDCNICRQISRRENCIPPSTCVKVMRLPRRKWDLRHSIANVWMCIDEFFYNFSSPTTYENQRISHTHGRIHTQQRETEMMTIGKICRADLANNKKANSQPHVSQTLIFTQSCTLDFLSSIDSISALPVVHLTSAFGDYVAEPARLSNAKKERTLHGRPSLVTFGRDVESRPQSLLRAYPLLPLLQQCHCCAHSRCCRSHCWMHSRCRRCCCCCSHCCMHSLCCSSNCSKRIAAATAVTTARIAAAAAVTAVCIAAVAAAATAACIAAAAVVTAARITTAATVTAAHTAAAVTVTVARAAAAATVTVGCTAAAAAVTTAAATATLCAVAAAATRAIVASTAGVALVRRRRSCRSCRCSAAAGRSAAVHVDKRWRVDHGDRTTGGRAGGRAGGREVGDQMGGKTAIITHDERVENYFLLVSACKQFINHPAGTKHVASIHFLQIIILFVLAT